MAVLDKDKSSGAGFQIVIVEDNVEANNLLRDWLKSKFGTTCFLDTRDPWQTGLLFRRLIPVICFLDAESTLRSLPPSDEPVVFLIDYKLPGDNGIMLKKKLVPLFPKGKYILVSGLIDDELAKEARGAGFNALVPKPFTMSTITEKIEELMGLKHKENLLDSLKRKRD